MGFGDAAVNGGGAVGGVGIVRAVFRPLVEVAPVVVWADDAGRTVAVDPPTVATIVRPQPIHVFT